MLKIIRRIWFWLLLSGIVLTTLVIGLHLWRQGFGWVQLQVGVPGSPWQLQPADWPRARLTLAGAPFKPGPGGKVWRRPGPVEASFALTHYQPWSGTVQVVKGATSIVQIPLRPEPRSIHLKGLPSGTQVVVCGQTNVVTDKTFSLKGAEVGEVYIFAILAPGCRPRFVPLAVTQPGRDAVLENLPLEASVGAVRLSIVPLQVKAPPLNSSFWSEITVKLDGQLVPDWRNLPAVPVGLHRLSVAHNDYFAAETEVVVTDGSLSDCAINLRPRPAELILSVLPNVPYKVEDAKGEQLLRVGDKVQVPPGEQTVRITALNYLPVERSFPFEPNKSYLWSARLERVGQKEFAAIKSELDRQLTSDNLRLLDKHGGKAWTDLKAVLPEPAAGEADPEQAAVQGRKVVASLPALLASAKLREEMDQERRAALQNAEKVLTNGNLAGAGTVLEKYRSRYGADDAYIVLKAAWTSEGLKLYKQRITTALGNQNQEAAVRWLEEFSGVFGKETAYQELAALTTKSAAPDRPATLRIVYDDKAFDEYFIYINGRGFGSVTERDKVKTFTVEPGSYSIRIVGRKGVPGSSISRARTVVDETLVAKPNGELQYVLRGQP
jgi:hypothetical protein